MHFSNMFFGWDFELNEDVLLKLWFLTTTFFFDNSVEWVWGPLLFLYRTFTLSLHIHTMFQLYQEVHRISSMDHGSCFVDMILIDRFTWIIYQSRTHSNFLMYLSLPSISESNMSESRKVEIHYTPRYSFYFVPKCAVLGLL